MGAKEGNGEKDKKVVDGGEKKKEGGGGAEKKEEGSPVVVFKVDMHCEGCASKIRRSVRKFEGVEGVTADMASSELAVTGKVDPWKLREHVEAKSHRKVEIVSPVNPPKTAADGGGGGGGGKNPAAAAGDSKDQKKSKELAASIVVLKIRLHCDGCIQRIKRAILKFKGVQEVSVDALKDLVTVKGTMDVNSLPPYIKDKLKRSAEIVPANPAAAAGGGGDKKDKAGGEKTKEKDGGGGGEKKEEGGGGEKKPEGGGGGEKKPEEGGGGGGEKKKEKEGGGGGKKEEAVKVVAAAAMVAPAVAETNTVEYYGSYGYRVEVAHAPQIFSDENPNACSVM